MRWNSSQVWFCVSHTSVVSVPRTARAFSRAAIRQERMLDGFCASDTMYCMTLRASTLPWRRAKSPDSSEMPSRPFQPFSAASADCGSSEVW